MAKVLITARLFGTVSDQGKQLLLSAGHQILPNPYLGRLLNENEVIELIEDADGIIAGQDALTGKAIAAGKNLKIITRYGVGIDKVDIASATKQKVIVTNTPGANSGSVAEYAMALMLAVARKIVIGRNSVIQGEWSFMTSTGLNNKVLGIIGLGKIGQGLAIRAKGFGMKIIAYDPYPNNQFAAENDIEFVDIQQLFRDSDFISLHAPGTKANIHLIGKQQLDLMKSTAFLINTARGTLIDEQALYKALLEKRIAGAGLDVLYNEPPGNNPLCTLENVVITPHLAANTTEAIENMDLMSVQAVIAYFKGERPPYVVNPEVY
ncbi:MAG TPA: hydroxyacid dehydrogenase [Firmicutes bacterium]|jgi:D-3-phosphoglycerate dehydrogenase|nr:hydroxyacid dehydrogenase [Bacillota bacterium]HBG44144.1 hydroxyacid dehydrogenase [Bacillota bacterium]